MPSAGQKVGGVSSRNSYFGLVILGVAATTLVGSLPAQATLLLTNIAQIRALSRQEASKAYPVQVQGVVTWQQANNAFVVDDGTQAVYVNLFSAKQQDVWAGGEPPLTESEPGAVVQVQGITDPGGYAPIINCVKFTRVGSGSIVPRHLKLEQLLSGSADASWVEVEGVVQAVVEENGRINGIRLLVAGQVCRVVFEHSAGLNSTNLLDADVKVRGALASVYNLRSQAVGLKLSVNGLQDIDVVSPPLQNPFQAPKVPLNGLRLFSPDSSAAFHRKVTEGIVVFAIPHRFFFLQDGTVGVRVESSSAVVQVGERVEVAGFVDISQAIASLHDAIICNLGTSEVSPVATTADLILHPPLNAGSAKEDLNCRLVRIQGKVLQFIHEESDGCNVLLIDAGGLPVKTYLPLTGFKESMPEKAWPSGSTVALTGVCELNLKEGAVVDSTVPIIDFKLWLRSPQDIKVIRSPPWWTVKRLWMALGGTGILVFAGILWALTLQRLLRQRTTRLEEVMSAHRDVELEYTSARRERLRLAADLHDGLKQLIGAAAFRLEAAQFYLPDTAIETANHLASAHTTMIRTQAELQNCMQGLHTLEEGPPELQELLRQVVARNDYWPKDAILIESRGIERKLPRDLAGNLLLLFQEGVANALRHGRASQIKALVDYTADYLELKIVDNGVGFDPAVAIGVKSGHFGLDGMQQRARWFRGDLAITRHEGGGMEVRVRIKWNVVQTLAPNSHNHFDKP